MVFTPHFYTTFKCCGKNLDSSDQAIFYHVCFILSDNFFWAHTYCTRFKVWCVQRDLSAFIRCNKWLLEFLSSPKILGHSPLITNINKVFSPRELQLTGYRLRTQTAQCSFREGLLMTKAVQVKMNLRLLWDALFQEINIFIFILNKSSKVTHRHTNIHTKTLST